MNKISKLSTLCIMGIALFSWAHERPSMEEAAPRMQKDTTPIHILRDYEVVWQDEFNGTHLDSSKWNYRNEGRLRKLATVSRNMVSLDGNGNLVLEAMRDTSGNYFIGHTSTEDIYETKYGYFECRAKMNKSTGPHIAFWLQSSKINLENDDPVANGAEIDIFEYHRRSPGKVQHMIHWNGYGAAHKQTGKVVNIAGIDEGFHTFGLEWNENEYIFYVNGKETWRTNEAVSQKSQYMVLSTELTGFGGAHDHYNYPDSVLFDYVRVYKPKN